MERRRRKKKKTSYSSFKIFEKKLWLWHGYSFLSMTVLGLWKIKLLIDTLVKPSQIFVYILSFQKITIFRTSFNHLSNKFFRIVIHRLGERPKKRRVSRDPSENVLRFRTFREILYFSYKNFLSGQVFCPPPP